GEEFGKFSKIELPPPRIEAGLFYIGWEQTVTTKPIKIGADFSKDSREKFYQYMGSNRRWLNPPPQDFYGTPMIRPKFGFGLALGMDDDIPVGIEDKEVVSKSVFE